MRFPSRVLRRNLNGIDTTFPHIITIGKALENESSCKSIIQTLCLNSTGNLALRSARRYLIEYFAEKYLLGNVSYLGPGQLDWSITEQSQLFSILGNAEQVIGVCLTGHFMMVPRKSDSRIIFPTESVFVGRQLFPRRNCQLRHATYDENLRADSGLGLDRW